MTGKATSPQQETIEGILDASKRPMRAAPIRRGFVQGGTQSNPVPGPLHHIVRHHDDRALDLYLLHRALVSSEPWTSRPLPAKAWARAIAVDTDVDGGKATVSKAWARLDETYGLIERRRSGRRGTYLSLREDGTRVAYEPPDGTAADPYLTVPFEYWTAEQQWYRTLTLPGKALLLIASTLGEDFLLPLDRVRQWYGLSEETAGRGIRELVEHQLLNKKGTMKRTPLEDSLNTMEYRYTLTAPFARRYGRTSTRPSKGTLATVTPLTAAPGA